MIPKGWVAHYRCGLHSGIPKCCIRFFVRSWWDLEPNARPDRSRSKANYVQCPACYKARRAVQTKTCECVWRHYVNQQGFEPGPNDWVLWFDANNHYRWFMLRFDKYGVTPPAGDPSCVKYLFMRSRRSQVHEGPAPAAAGPALTRDVGS
jgi:hypothetical protein